VKPEQEQATASHRTDESRRRFLKTASKLAVYTPPAMLVMAQPSYAEIMKSGGASGAQEFPQRQLQKPGCVRSSGPSTMQILRRFCRFPS
jgi:hypothetical protein